MSVPAPENNYIYKYLYFYHSELRRLYNWSTTVFRRIARINNAVFKYNKAMHDVRQVSHEDFQSCKAKAPIEEYTTGMDSITLKMAGHHYFLCGIPGHCQVGQKVEINVLPGASSPGESPAPSPNDNGSPAPSPSHTESPAPSPGHTGSSTPPPSSGGSSSSTPAEPGEGSSSSTPPPSSSAPSLWSSNFWFAAPGMLAVFLTAFAF